MLFFWHFVFLFPPFFKRGFRLKKRSNALPKWSPAPSRSLHAGRAGRRTVSSVVNLQQDGAMVLEFPEKGKYSGKRQVQGQGRGSFQEAPSYGKQETLPLTGSQHNDIVVLVIPPFQPDGTLPPGVHWADSMEIQARFGQSPHRHQLLQGFLGAVKELKAVGCKEVFLDGSFVTAKTSPNDYDACWGTGGVDPSQLDAVFFDFTNRRARQKARFQGEFFPADTKEGLSGRTFLEFFQVDKQTGDPKGIVGLQL
jgi:hypothetical protein